MAQLGGLQGLGGPINYYDQMVPDFRGEALKASQANAMDVQARARQQEMTQQQKDNQRRDDFYSAIQSATPDQLPALRRQFPEFAQNIQQEIGIQDEDHAKFVNKSLNSIAIARASGDPRMMQDAIQKSAPALASMNMSTDQAMQLLQTDPQRFDGMLRGAQLATLPFEKQVDVGQKQQQIDETARSNRASEAVQWANNGIAQQNVNIRRMELDDKKYDRQIANETNALKLADLQDKRQQNQQKIEQAQRDKSDSFHQANDTFSQTIDTANKVLNSPGFDSYFGVSLSKLPGVGTLPGTDAADTEALVNTLSSQGFLASIQQMKGMGALSDAEGKKISSAISSLDSKQSDKSARESIKTIISVTQNAQRRLQNRYGDSVQPKQPTQQQSQQPTAEQPAGGSYTSKSGIQFTVR